MGWDEKFAAHNAALWRHGLLVVVPKGVELEKPLYVRISATGQTFWRLVVVAEEGAHASLIEEYASARPDLNAYSNAVAELFSEADSVDMAAASTAATTSPRNPAGSCSTMNLPNTASGRTSSG